jgi:hypothetical protein
MIALLLTATGAWAAPIARHVFIISLDGGNPAVVKQSKMPELFTLADQGAYTWKAQTILILSKPFLFVSRRARSQPELVIVLPRRPPSTA